ncbi:MAG: hypothetical protein MJ146_04425, partial [Clostridia bacterium]|nr:hypothetical protein [Clostridia bacterium]
MKNKIITLVVSLALVFTMSVPAFAADEPVTAKSVQDSVSYFAVGDSVAAGCKNLNFMWAAFDPSAGSTTDDHFFNEYNYFKDGKMNGDVYAVPFSFVYRVAEKLGASKASSFNGSYIGLRSKDVCQILGLPEAKAGDYANDQWSQTIDMFARMFNMSPEQLATLTSYEELYKVSGLYDSPALKQQYVDGIKNADVITVELGENDLTAFLINHSDMIEQTFTDLTNGIEGIPGAAVLAGRFVEDFNAFATASDSSQKFEAAKKLNEDILLLVSYGVGYAEIVKRFADMINEMNLQGIYYTQELLNYINENKKDDAIVVVCTIIDPFKDMAVDSVASESLGVGALVKIMDLIVNPYSKLIGQNLKDHAFTNGVRNYYVADISGVSVNPAKEVLNPPYVDEAQEVEYLLHPSNAGQQQIADLILAQVAKAKKAAAKKERAELVKQVVKEEVDSYTKAAVMVGTTQLVKDSIQAQINAYVLKQAVEKAKKIHKVNKALLKAAVAKKVTKDVVRAAVVKQQVKKAVAKKVVKDTVKAVVKQQVKKAVAKKVVKDTAKAAVATAV